MSGRLLLSLLALSLLAGCGGDMGELRGYIEEVKSRPGEQIEPLPRIESPEPFVYSAMDLRDPFRGGPEQAEDDEEVLAVEEGPRPDPNRRRELLEGFELDSLDMVGTLLLEEELFGLIQDPEGLIHRVRPGNYLGRNHGRIILVDEDEIGLVELIPDGAGGYLERDAALALDDE